MDAIANRSLSDYATSYAMSNVIEGLLIGVGVGIILGAMRLTLWIWQHYEQVAYVREVISRDTKQILEVPQLPPSKSSAKPIASDSVRFACVREFQSHMQTIFLSRATALTYKEISSLQKIMADLDRAMIDLNLTENKTMPLQIFEGINEKFRKLSWLKLP